MINNITITAPDNTVYVLTQIGRKYAESSEIIMNEARSASGKSRRDVVAEKKTFSLTYEAIDNVNLLQVEDLLSRYVGAELTFRVDRMNAGGGNRIDVYTVFMRPFSRERLPRGLWGGVTVEFVEV